MSSRRSHFDFLDFERFSCTPTHSGFTSDWFSCGFGHGELMLLEVGRGAKRVCEGKWGVVESLYFNGWRIGLGHLHLLSSLSCYRIA